MHLDFTDCTLFMAPYALSLSKLDHAWVPCLCRCKTHFWPRPHLQHPCTVVGATNVLGDITASFGKCLFRRAFSPIPTPNTQLRVNNRVIKLLSGWPPAAPRVSRGDIIVQIT